MDVVVTVAADPEEGRVLDVSVNPVLEVNRLNMVPLGAGGGGGVIGVELAGSVSGGSGSYCGDGQRVHRGARLVRFTSSLRRWDCREPLLVFGNALRLAHSVFCSGDV